ncbi:kinase-like protein [Lophiostoma macrostomum CBS 122681]|uniref:Kinase-like protein n=1 Tax=Lophiostoma macrostomum CBS 122681 TaxID=1314788 RepID=A0A6A6TCS9_9PLEO|nr:kinase-like protein [Lophiostoma macrostomum CBS 122681]
MDSTLEDDISQYLEDHMAKLEFRFQTQEFVPRDIFEIATSKMAIEQAVKQEEDELELISEDLDNFVTDIHQCGRKLFAACVRSGLAMTCLKRLLAKGFTDLNQPRADCDCDCPNLKPRDRKTFRHFLDSLKKFNAPFFATNSFQALDSNTPIPIQFAEDSSNLRGKGAFGEVWEMNIHKSHHNLLPGSHIDRFAVKIIQQEVSWRREKAFITDMASLNHQHLVKCLASWTLGAKYHMIYELAACNLDEFVKKFPEPSQDSGLPEEWLAKQLCGIAGALLVVHNQGADSGSSSSLMVPTTAPAKTGYIHDIKPENILVYRYQGHLYWFRLSDFSCAKVVDLVATVSGQRLSHMTTGSGTPNYKAPETHTGKTSRPYDLFSLGCVYLELLTWYFQGYSALVSFKKARREQRRSPNGPQDEGFYFTLDSNDLDDDSNPTWHLRHAVVGKISELQEQCHGPLKRILDEIPNLLKIEPLERPTAKQLAQRLDAPGPELNLDMLSPVSRRDSMLPDSPPLTPKLHTNNHSNETDEHDFVMRFQQATE